MASKLVLGTVQLGMPYGIGNVHGQPDEREAFDILDLAWDSGIDTFDTAPTYGSAEKMLGAWIRARGLGGSIHIVSKVKRHDEEMEQEIKRSLRTLGIERLYGALLHSPDTMRNSNVVSELQRIKHEHKTLNIGTSTYTPEEADEALGKGFDFIQVPYNVFDRRLDKSNFFKRAKERSVTVFARSPSLQGLLLMSPDTIPAHLARARAHVVRFREIAAAHGHTPLEAALMFVLANPGIGHVVFGVETVLQLEQVLAASCKTIDAVCVAALRRAFDAVESTIIDPREWDTRTAA